MHQLPRLCDHVVARRAVVDLIVITEKATAWLARHPWWALTFALLITAAALPGVVQIPLFTARKALMPADAPVSVMMDRFLKKFGAASDLIVVIEGGTPKEMRTFADALVERLDQEPFVKQAVARIDLGFFYQHAYLLAPPEQLEQAASVLSRIVAPDCPQCPELKDWDSAFDLATMLLSTEPEGSLARLETTSAGLKILAHLLAEWVRFIDAEDAPESIDLQRFLDVVEQKQSASQLVSDGYFSSNDQKMLFLFVRSATTSEEFEQIAPFVEGVRSVAESLRTEQGGLQVGFTGLPAIVYEEFTTLQRDIVVTVCTATLLILILIGVWLRSIRWALVVFIPMGLGVIWNLGLTYLTVGHLTMITSSFTAILFGLGVDYGIFLSTRIIEAQKKKGRLLYRAISKGASRSITALLMAGGATVLIFGALSVVPLTGFAELGIVAASGVILVLLSTLLVQPAVFALLPPSVQEKQKKEEGEREHLVKLSRKRNVSLVVIGLMLAAAGAVYGYFIPFDYDVLSLLPRDSEAAHYQRRMVEESDLSPEVVILTAADLEEARMLTSSAESLASVSRVQSMTRFFPIDSETRVRLGRRIGRTLDEAKTLKQVIALGEPELSQENLSKIKQALLLTSTRLADAEELAFSAGHEDLVKTFEKINDHLETLTERLVERPDLARARSEQFARVIMKAMKQTVEILSSWKSAHGILPADLPIAVRERFFAADGTVAVYAYPSQSVYDPEYLAVLVKEVNGISSHATGFPMTHQVYSRMVVDSFQQGTVLAFLAAIVWMLLILRSMRGLVITLLPLVVGGGWMMGMLGILGIELNYANVIALPLVMGLAVDYGVWFAHRRRELSHLSTWEVTVIAGKAILLAAATTLAGLGAIMMAQYRGVSTMGVSITVGLCCCVLAALTISPAITRMLYKNPNRHRRKRKRKSR